MIVKSYYLENTKEAKEQIDRIIHCIPCFLESETDLDNYIEFSVQCRAEYVKYLEGAVAAYV